ncbi:MAG: triose-phosphate isomerase [bacterium]|uniref:Triosephosphate isomerase n=2 Tax=Bacteria candidate phyla TaxID=1783234 RepID=A0A101I354_UNCT6|nr:MAG: tpiA [candidate division TA06 bacterium 32_111]KUK88116.1 MAG: tpiA [candidate division TA06 bacterium 34_109]MDI6700917.1 triose-phosphate isomerase [bacterium]HAF07046.1 triose-phosphate isomerase [candidate division WOR-3 bacterium]HCP16961.1 triose-phosphate isomerase [candidate division WOR-3 bacterium]
MRKVYVAGNWKMNLIDEIQPLKEFSKDIKNDIEVIVFPPFTHLQKYGEILKGSKVKVGAQNVFYEEKGAYTGEISYRFLQEFGCEYVILGHSERRNIFRESDELVSLKIKKILSSSIKPILCVGEREEERSLNKQKFVVENQLKISLGGIENNFKNIIIAYEPVWAIGTGKNASPYDAQEMHSFIREQLSSLFGKKISYDISILYGGSVNEENVKDLFREDDVDGVLVGGASLKCDKFIKIVEIVDKSLI